MGEAAVDVPVRRVLHQSAQRSDHETPYGRTAVEAEAVMNRCRAGAGHVKIGQDYVPDFRAIGSLFGIV
jgi:hypothetical protein